MKGFIQQVIIMVNKTTKDIRSPPLLHTERTVADIAIREGTFQGIVFSHRATIPVDVIPSSKPELRIGGKKTETPEDPKELVALLNNSGSSTIAFLDAIWGGGSTIVLQTPSGRRYMVFVLRDNFTSRWPNTIGNLSGIGNSVDPMLACLTETVGEVLIIRNRDNRALVPILKGREGDYYYAMRSEVQGQSYAFGARGIAYEDADRLDLTHEFSLEGVPVAFGICHRLGKFGETCYAMEIIPRPIVYDIDNLGAVTMRETLYIETEGRRPERKIVLVNLDTTATLVYHQGEQIGAYGTFKTFVHEQGLDTLDPFFPGSATLIANLETVFTESMTQELAIHAIPFLEASRR